MNGNTAADEDGDRVSFQYKGRNFLIPRSDYERRLTEQDHNLIHDEDENGEDQLHCYPLTGRVRRSYGYEDAYPVTSSTGNPSTSSISQAPTSAHPEWKKKLNEGLLFLETLENTLRNSSPPDVKSIPKEMESLEKQKSTIEHSYSLENISKSKESVGENLPTTEPIEAESSIAVPQSSEESFDARKPSSEVTEKLAQLKSQVINLIDQTITQFETEQKQKVVVPLHPSGDGSNHLVDVQTLTVQVAKTESPARDKKEIRLKLFREIEVVMKRLKEIELLD